MGELLLISVNSETINNLVDWRTDNSKVSLGFLIETLIVTILRGRRPLWKIEEYWAQQKFDLMFEGSSISVEQLNDDAYARALDKLKTINIKELIHQVFDYGAFYGLYIDVLNFILSREQPII